jgi:hypothetical protein
VADEMDLDRRAADAQGAHGGRDTSSPDGSGTLLHHVPLRQVQKRADPAGNAVEDVADAARSARFPVAEPREQFRSRVRANLRHPFGCVAIGTVDDREHQRDEPVLLLRIFCERRQQRFGLRELRLLDSRGAIFQIVELAFEGGNHLPRILEAARPVGRPVHFAKRLRRPIHPGNNEAA